MRYSRGREHTNSEGSAKPGANRSKTQQATQHPAKGPHSHILERPEKCLDNSRKGPDKLPALLSAALKYAERSIPVFPLRPGGKEPLTPRGFKDATTNHEQIRRWWARWPLANIGLPTGELSGLLVLDHDAYKPGAMSREALERKHGPIPKTTTVRTGRGGFQYLFLYPAGSGIRNSAGGLGPGLDVRGEGGYVVAPPSRTDGLYEWVDRSTLATPPEWLLEAARTPYSAAGGETNQEARPTLSADLDGEPIPEGQRNQELTRVAGSLRARGLELEGLEAELLAVNAARCSPPLEASEVAGIARSVGRYPTGDATPEPDPETLEAVERLFSGVLERLNWKGRSGPTDRAVYAALLITARRYGRPCRGGVKVYLSVRALALAAGVSRPTAIKALDRLRAKKLVYRASEGSGPKAGALVLRATQTPTQAFTTQPHGGEVKDSGQPLRSLLRELLRLRWGPGRIGKLCALLLEVIARSGQATLSALSEQTDRRRCDIRRTLRRLEASGLVECFGETVRLVADFAAVLERELEATGITRSECLDRARYEREQRAFREAWEAGAVKKGRWRDFRREREQRTSEPDGFIENLERIEPERRPEPENPTEPGAVLTDARDPEQFRELAALVRRGIAEHRRKHPPLSAPERAARLYRRLRLEDPELFAALRSDPRKLAWEISGRGWTDTVYSGNTTRAALELLEAERVAA